MKSAFHFMTNNHKPRSIALMTGALCVALGLTACGTNTQTTATPKAAQATAKSASPSDDGVVKALQANLTKSGVDLTVKSAQATDMEGIYWVMFDDAPPMFTDTKGKHLIQGQIVKLGDTPTDITSALQSSLAKESLAKVDSSEMIIFPATGEQKASIYVFSDPTCHYCQKLHSEIKDINAQGIEVRYLAWPRSDAVVPLAEAIWCSRDRQDALTRAKHGENITADTCDNPVARHMELGHQLGVNGTPAIFTESGRQIGGYLPSDELAKLAIKYKND